MKNKTIKDNKKKVEEDKNKTKVPQKVKGKDKKNEIEEEEEILPPKENKTNIERFIYITIYKDINFLSIIKSLFEEINQTAFNLRSPIEINTRILTDEEKDNNDIDYISGVQLLDNYLRITIVEGVTGLGLQKVKEKLPKTQLNNKTLRILADSNVLFNKRIYSKFNLSLKFIKLRDNLSSILQTYNIYQNANRYREIYDTFLNYGSILKAESMKEILSANLFPEADSLLMVERKYGDILKEEDLDGIPREKKKRAIIKIEDLLTRSSISGASEGSISLNKKRTISCGDYSKDISLVDRSHTIDNNKIPRIRGRFTKSQENIDKGNFIEQNGILKKLRFKQKLDSKNLLYEKFLKEKITKKLSSSEIWKRNFDYINEMKKKTISQRFCKPFTGTYDASKDINFYPVKNNYYNTLIKQMREKYLNDKNHYYSYSNYGLSLSFPMKEPYLSEEYINYLENKSKWYKGKDFERYKQPEKEKVYFPKIKNAL